MQRQGKGPQVTDGVQLSIRPDPAALARLSSLSKTFPKEVQRAQLQAASIAVRKIRAAVRKMGNGDTGVLAPLSPLRLAVRPNTPPGGLLSTAASTLCRVQKRGSTLYAGYVSGVEGVFSRWQEGGSTPLNTRARQYLHKQLAYGGHSGVEVPETAEQPGRPVVAPIHRVASREYPRWVERAALKAIDKTLRKAGR